MTRKTAIFLAAIVLAFGLGMLIMGWTNYASAIKTEDPPAGKNSESAEIPEVLVELPVEREIADFEEVLGRIEPSQSVEIRSRATGYLTSVNCQPGSLVKRGDLLFSVDPRPYQLEVDRRKAEVSKNEARWNFMKGEQDRANQKIKDKSISPEQLDRILMESAEAQADLAIDRARLKQAELQLEFTSLKAPIDGQIGQPQLEPGGLVVENESLLATIICSDPLNVRFELPESTLSKILRNMREGKGPTNVLKEMPVQCSFADGQEVIAKLNAVDNHIDPTTGTLRYWASLPNFQKRFLPGMSVRVKVPMSAPYRAVLVPERAIGTDQARPSYLWVVNEKEVVMPRQVSLGAIHDGQRVITAGLMPNEQVVVGGIDRLKSGMKVKVRRSPDPH